MITYKEFSNYFEVSKKEEKGRILYTAIYCYVLSNDKRFVFDDICYLLDSISANLSNFSRGKKYIKESKDLKQIKRGYYTLTSKALKNYSDIIDFLLVNKPTKFNSI